MVWTGTGGSRMRRLCVVLAFAFLVIAAAARAGMVGARSSAARKSRTPQARGRAADASPSGRVLLGDSSVEPSTVGKPRARWRCFVSSARERALRHRSVCSSLRTAPQRRSRPVCTAARAACPVRCSRRVPCPLREPDGGIRSGLVRRLCVPVARIGWPFWPSAAGCSSVIVVMARAWARGPRWFVWALCRRGCAG